MNLRIGIPFLLLFTFFGRTFAERCENVIQLADLREIIKNQTKLIEDLQRTIRNLNTGKIWRLFFNRILQQNRRYHGISVMCINVCVRNTVCSASLLSGTGCHQIHLCYSNCPLFTVSEVQSIRPFARRSVNSGLILQWWSVRKYLEA